MDPNFTPVKRNFKVDIKKMHEHTEIKPWSFYWAISVLLKENKNL